MRRYTLWKFFGMMAAAIALGADAPVNWGLGHFVRPEGVNPAIAPRAESVFSCPMRKTQIHWEALHAFNPAAVVRNGKVYVHVSRRGQYGRDADRDAHLPTGAGGER